MTLPLILPGIFEPLPGEVITSDVDFGGYDFSIGGHGFRFATDQNFPYQRVTEPTQNRRFDESSEPGEQSLSPLPWIKSQSSFHGGAGQLNLEQGRNSFQYQQEQVDRLRFDTCLGVDVWKPGEVSRLPTTTITSTATAVTDFVATNSSSNPTFDVIMAGGVHCLYNVVFGSGADVAGTVNSVTLTNYGGASNVTVDSIVSDGAYYYAIFQLAADSTLGGAGVRTVVVKGLNGFSTEPAVLYKAAADSTQHPGTLGWAKARLMAGLDNKMYELDVSVAGAALPTPKYTHPSTAFRWSTITEGPTSVLAAGQVNSYPDILALELDTNGAVPTLTGGTSVAQLPAGELVTSMRTVLNSFLALGTTKGVRIGTFDTYSGRLKLGPLSVETTAPVYGVAPRDRFIYAGFTNQQADGTTGLCRVDLSMIVDSAGRNAWAPDLRPPTTAATGHGTVVGLGILPNAQRMVWYSTDGFHVEGGAPAATGSAWVKTSRIRYDTTESKLFKSARITGTLDAASVQVTAHTPYGGARNVGTFGFFTEVDTGEFNLPSELSEWMQLQFSLIGTSCVLSSYQVKSYPAPKVQDVITVTANCFLKESDRGGLDVIDPETPRQRFENVRQLKLAGAEVRYVEFTNQGPVAETVLIDQVAFQSFSRPTDDSDLGGYITLKLRVTQ
jgi:hypothetical protein